MGMCGGRAILLFSTPPAPIPKGEGIREVAVLRVGGGKRSEVLYPVLIGPHARQVVDEAMLEELSCLLATGEVPSLFSPEEEADHAVRVRDALRASGKADTRVCTRRGSGDGGCGTRPGWPCPLLPMASGSASPTIDKHSLAASGRRVLYPSLARGSLGFESLPIACCTRDRRADARSTAARRRRCPLSLLCLACQANSKAFFTARVRDRLHVVLCLDPAGPAFRERVRNFPSLVNCR